MRLLFLLTLRQTAKVLQKFQLHRELLDARKVSRIRCEGAELLLEKASTILVPKGQKP